MKVLKRFANGLGYLHCVMEEFNGSCLHGDGSYLPKMMLKLPSPPLNPCDVALEKRQMAVENSNINYMRTLMKFWGVES